MFDIQMDVKVKRFADRRHVLYNGSLSSKL
jgi:hypothetical protein